MASLCDLLSDIPSMYRAGRFSEALGLLRVILISLFSSSDGSRATSQPPESDRDRLYALRLSGLPDDFDAPLDLANPPDDDIFSLNPSLDSAPRLVRYPQDGAAAIAPPIDEYDSCAPQLGNIIFSLTGQNFPDCVSNFVQDFKTAVRVMAHRVDLLNMVNINGFVASYATVRGDGNCLFRAFLTALAYQTTGVVLPFDPKDMLDWIIRLKLLMCHHIQETVRRNPNFEAELRSIPENGTVRNLQQYFTIYMRNGYYGTNYDLRLLARMFHNSIHVIREHPVSGETHQTFPPSSAEVHAIRPGDIIILYQGGHYVAIIDVFNCTYSPAVAPET